MLPLLTAVFVASLMGSMHCIGMCGPLALWASGAGRVQDGGGRKSVFLPMVAYHFGRFTTYGTAGLLAGLFGAAVTAGGQWLGMQSLAARLVGAMMIAFAIIRLAKWTFPQWWQPNMGEITQGTAGGAITVSGGAPSGGPLWSQWVSRWVALQRPWIARLPLFFRGYAAGALTTLLPCGWLYLFVLVAMGSGGIIPSMVVMGAFWLGTLPALTILIVGAIRFAPGLRSWLPLAGSLLLLVTGFYTATGRAEADLRPLSRRVAAMATEETSTNDTESVGGVIQAMNELVKEPLPCCIDRDQDRSE